MIVKFGNRLAENLFLELESKSTRSFPTELKTIARRKLQYLNAAVRLDDLRIPPGNMLKQLRGDLKEFYSIRINDQWRIIFKWCSQGASEVAIVNYH